MAIQPTVFHLSRLVLRCYLFTVTDSFNKSFFFFFLLPSLIVPLNLITITPLNRVLLKKKKKKKREPLSDAFLNVQLLQGTLNPR